MAINATLGTVDYRYNGVIAVPVTFSENVVSPSKTVFPISHDSGDALTGIDYILAGQNTAFQLVFDIPPNRKGRFRIASNGSVLKGSVQSGSEPRDTVMVTPLTIPYDTTVPEMIDLRVSRVRAANRTFPDDEMNPPSGDRVDCILRYNTRCTLNDPVAFFGSDDATFADFLDYAGANLPPPNFYRKTDNDFPGDDDLPLVEVLQATEWTQETLTADDSEATIYLLRWDDIGEYVDLEVRIKPGFVRGPVRFTDV